METQERYDFDGLYSPRRRDLKVIRREIARKRIAEMMNDEMYADLGFFRRIAMLLTLKLGHPIHGGAFQRAKDNFDRWYAWNVAKPKADRPLLGALMIQDCKDAGVDLKGDIQTTYFAASATIGIR